MIVNCLAIVDGQIVMLQKPRRGWWVLPGGKVDVAETWPEAAAREMQEETGLTVGGLELFGVHRLRITGDDGHIKERTIAQFSAREIAGDLLSHCKEGILDRVSLDKWDQRPMDLGDKIMIQHSLERLRRKDHRVDYGMFIYDANHGLLDWSMVRP